MKLDSDIVNQLREKFPNLPAQYDLLVIVIFACIYAKLGMFNFESLHALEAVDDVSLGVVSAFVFGLDALAVISYIEEVHPRVYDYISSDTHRM